MSNPSLAWQQHTFSQTIYKLASEARPHPSSATYISESEHTYSRRNALTIYRGRGLQMEHEAKATRPIHQRFGHLSQWQHQTTAKLMSRTKNTCTHISSAYCKHCLTIARLATPNLKSLAIEAQPLRACTKYIQESEHAWWIQNELSEIYGRGL